MACFNQRNVLTKPTSKKPITKLERQNSLDAFVERLLKGKGFCGDIIGGKFENEDYEANRNDPYDESCDHFSIEESGALPTNRNHRSKPIIFTARAKFLGGVAEAEDLISDPIYHDALSAITGSQILDSRDSDCSDSNLNIGNRSTTFFSRRSLLSLKNKCSKFVTLHELSFTFAVEKMWETFLMFLLLYSMSFLVSSPKPDISNSIGCAAFQEYKVDGTLFSNRILYGKVSISENFVKTKVNMSSEF
mmetsp:Transcript_11812/g.13457  ORF Transcript_11812/g.13457 Transcript_11812/m.13457 type:complete len:248 (-) Transcript_11812:307-1050(-)